MVVRTAVRVREQEDRTTCATTACCLRVAMAEPLRCALRYLLPRAVLLEEWEGRELAKVGGDELLLLGVSWRAAATNRRG